MMSNSDVSVLYVVVVHAQLV